MVSLQGPLQTFPVTWVILLNPELASHHSVPEPDPQRTVIGILNETSPRTRSSLSCVLELHFLGTTYNCSAQQVYIEGSIYLSGKLIFSSSFIKI